VGLSPVKTPPLQLQLHSRCTQAFRTLPPRVPGSIGMSTLTVGMVVVGLQLILGPQVAALFAHIITGGKTQSIIRMVGPSDQVLQPFQGR